MIIPLGTMPRLWSLDSTRRSPSNVQRMTNFSAPAVAMVIVSAATV
jgi:hypothetical protein